MADTSRASGRFLLRIDPGLHAALRAAARAAGLSLNDYCARKLASPGSDPTGPATAVVARAARIHGDTLLGVVAYGSWARGEATPTSDLDLLIVLAPDAPLHRRLYDAWDEAPLTWSGLTVEPHLVRLPAPGDPPSGLWGEAALDGIVLHDPGLRVTRYLASMRRRLATEVASAAKPSPGHTESERFYARRFTSARDHLHRARARLQALDVLFEAESWADVVRESQEVVELTLKGLLRWVGVDPPRIHDVSPILEAERDRLPPYLRTHLPALTAASHRLRRDRELAFYGAEDLTPSGFYVRDDAEVAREAARRTVDLVAPHVEGEG